jgi:hypothetical protein
MKMRRCPPVVIGAVLTLAASAAAETPPSPPSIAIHADSSVTVDGVTYPDMASYHSSPAFRDNGRRCATAPPAPDSIMAPVAPTDCSLYATSVEPEYEPEAGPAYEIPVVFHVVSASDGTGDLSDELIRSQIDILNEDFGAVAGTPGEPGTDSRVRFALAAFTPDGSPTTGINRVTDDSWFSDRGDMKGELAWDTTRYLNIYTNTASGALGYATFPQESAGSGRDGVVLLWSSVGRDAPDGGRFDQGRTATHEVGHYLGLYHTFQDGCGNVDGYSSGDLIADTTPEARPEYGCEERPSSCGNGDNPIHNYMDYTDDTCMDHFTPEQVNRMRCTIAHYRLALINELPATRQARRAGDLEICAAHRQVEDCDVEIDQADGAAVHDRRVDGVAAGGIDRRWRRVDHRVDRRRRVSVSVAVSIAVTVTVTR